jgi:histidine triad (HIT) family protein
LADDCIFCKIVQKTNPASWVYEDEHIGAFLSNQPVNQGHTLVIPKKHYINIYDIPADEVAYLFKITKRIALLARDTFNAEGIRVVQNNGKAAGQVVFHLHVHIIPMHSKDEFGHDGTYRDKTKQRTEPDLKTDAEKMRQTISAFK